MATKEEYKHVLEDLKECRLFYGHYDATNGSPHFMSGIETVMDWIADKAGDEDFETAFLVHLVMSEERAKRWAK